MKGKKEESLRMLEFKGLLRAGVMLVAISAPALVTGVVEKNIALEAAGLFGSIIGGIITGDSVVFRKNPDNPEKV
ncbi:MAG TPA: hypothetical protein VNF06_03100 [Candidatus Aquilonibacter sp.]|nr:hypothetical protein [Candidatus Aquilonibacter sp.]